MKPRYLYLIGWMLCLLNLHITQDAARADEKQGPMEYEFVPNARDDVVIFVLGRWIFSGYIDEKGIFVPDPGKQPILHPVIGGSRVNSVIEDVAYVRRASNYADQKHEEVYEYRDGTLIRGTLGVFGFRPGEGTKVISFKDYKYSKTALRIYNLPGKFVKKGKPAKEKGITEK